MINATAGVCPVCKPNAGGPPRVITGVSCQCHLDYYALHHNPPFGGMEEDGTEKNFPATFRTKETADLFIILIIHLLRDGGRGAMVLPAGTLFAEGVTRNCAD